MIELNVVLEKNTIDQYDNLLKRFKEWKENKREINLNFLLNPNSKIEFIIDPNSKFPLYSKNNQKICYIESLKFILKSNIVENLYLYLNINSKYTPYLSKKLHHDLKVYQKIENNSIISFYIKD
jgi:hypothetical protein